MKPKAIEGKKHKKYSAKIQIPISKAIQIMDFVRMQVLETKLKTDEPAFFFEVEMPDHFFGGWKLFARIEVNPESDIYKYSFHRYPKSVNS